MPEAEPGHEEPRERLKMGSEMEPETKKPKNKSLKLQEPFYLSLLICLPQLTLRSYFAERQF